MSEQNQDNEESENNEQRQRESRFPGWNQSPRRDVPPYPTYYNPTNLPPASLISGPQLSMYSYSVPYTPGQYPASMYPQGRFLPPHLINPTPAYPYPSQFPPPGQWQGVSYPYVIPRTICERRVRFSEVTTIQIIQSAQQQSSTTVQKEQEVSTDDAQPAPASKSKPRRSKRSKKKAAASKQKTPESPHPEMANYPPLPALSALYDPIPSTSTDLEPLPSTSHADGDSNSSLTNTDGPLSSDSSNNSSDTISSSLSGSSLKASTLSSPVPELSTPEATLSPLDSITEEEDAKLEDTAKSDEEPPVCMYTYDMPEKEELTDICPCHEDSGTPEIVYKHNYEKPKTPPKETPPTRRRQKKQLQRKPLCFEFIRPQPVPRDSSSSDYTDACGKSGKYVRKSKSSHSIRSKKEDSGSSAEYKRHIFPDTPSQETVPSTAAHEETPASKELPPDTVYQESEPLEVVHEEITVDGELFPSALYQESLPLGVVHEEVTVSGQLMSSAFCQESMPREVVHDEDTVDGQLVSDTLYRESVSMEVEEGTVDAQLVSDARYRESVSMEVVHEEGTMGEQVMSGAFYEESVSREVAHGEDTEGGKLMPCTFHRQSMSMEVIHEEPSMEDQGAPHVSFSSQIGHEDVSVGEGLLPEVEIPAENQQISYGDGLQGYQSSQLVHCPQYSLENTTSTFDADTSEFDPPRGIAGSDYVAYDSGTSGESTRSISIKRPARLHDQWFGLMTLDGQMRNPRIAEQIRFLVGDAQLVQAQSDYTKFQNPRECLVCETDHILEMYDLTIEIETVHIRQMFKEYISRGFRVKWLDDAHCLLVFANAEDAGAALKKKLKKGKLRRFGESDIQGLADDIFIKFNYFMRPPVPNR